jgi:hypothetical protein
MSSSIRSTSLMKRELENLESDLFRGSLLVAEILLVLAKYGCEPDAPIGPNLGQWGLWRVGQGTLIIYWQEGYHVRFDPD